MNEELPKLTAADCYGAEPDTALTLQQVTAAALVADGGYARHVIAKRVGVSERTIFNWLQLPAFREELRRHEDEWRDAAVTIAIARRLARLKSLDDIRRRIEAAWKARAEMYKDSDVPGGHTGIVCRKERAIPIGDKEFSTVIEYEIDTGSIAEYRATLEQAQREMGHHKQVHELTGPDGEPLELGDDNSTNVFQVVFVEPVAEDKPAELPNG